MPRGMLNHVAPLLGRTPDTGKVNAQPPRPQNRTSTVIRLHGCKSGRQAKACRLSALSLLEILALTCTDMARLYRRVSEMAVVLGRNRHRGSPCPRTGRAA